MSESYTYRFGAIDAAKEFVKLLKDNDALDLLSVRRTRCTVVVDHLGVDFDAGHIHGAAQALGGEG